MVVKSERSFYIHGMAKLSEEQKLARRLQILNAGWRCFDRNGLHATRMDDIIAEAGLSAGAVYSYFKNKDDLVQAALITSMTGLAERLRPILESDDPAPPAVLLENIAAAIEAFTKRDGFDLKRLALLGWAESQRDEKLKGIMQAFYEAFLAQLAGCVARWKAAGLVDGATETEPLARALLALLLGYTVQAAVVGGMSPGIFRQGVETLTAPRAG
ncbi:TetR/AcrR family transcriptional regulator [Hyphomicrobium sp.]|uniref:TetR/AcrR family transcriptional regulator n=1 Tax=Hyphomicrobium sp. TaxID=82 RepID=UPI002FE05B5D